MKKYKKSVILPLLLFVYTTLMAIYFLPRNTEIGRSEKWITIVASYLIILLLWWVLRTKEKMTAKQEQDRLSDKDSHTPDSNRSGE